MNHWTLGLIVFGSQAVILLIAGLLFKKTLSEAVISENSNLESESFLSLYIHKVIDVFGEKEMYLTSILFIALFLTIGLWQGWLVAVLFLSGAIMAGIGEFIESVVLAKLNSSRLDLDKQNEENDGVFLKKTSLISASLSSFSISIIFVLYFVLNFGAFYLTWISSGVLAVFASVMVFRYLLNKKRICSGNFEIYFLLSILPLILALNFIGTISSIVFPFLLSIVSILIYVIGTIILLLIQNKNLENFYKKKTILMLISCAIIFYPLSSMIFGAGYFKIYLSSLIGILALSVLALFFRDFLTEKGKLLKKVFLCVVIIVLSVLAAYKLEGFYGITLGLSAIAPFFHSSNKIS